MRIFNEKPLTTIGCNAISENALKISTSWKLSLRHHQYNFQADDDDGGDVALMTALVVVVDE